MNQIQIGKIKNLVTVLNEYRDAYYNRQQPLVSDVEYDKLAFIEERTCNYTISY